MILLVPTSPEVPQRYAAKLWPGLVLVIFLGIGFLEANEILQADTEFVDSLYSIGTVPGANPQVLRPEAYAYLKLRPLLKISPAFGDWDFKRVLLANFVHGSSLHLFLNLIGAFAGARILAPFMPFYLTMMIFILGGSTGILASVLLSNNQSAYIPHVGASGGIFAMMGAYYVYNFKFRTRYFFWFPNGQGSIALKTSWFFFVDVILLELVLSTAQLIPESTDTVDHFAHVFGFASGMLLAFTIRRLVGWPSLLQTRGEYLYWKQAEHSGQYHPVLTVYNRVAELLEINPYNDQLKMKLLRHLSLHCKQLTDEQLRPAFKFISPTYVRMHPEESAGFVKEILFENKKLPLDWLATIPYDSIIQLAKVMTNPPEEQYLLLRLVTEYRKAQKESGDIDRKLELLMRRLQDLMPSTELSSSITATQQNPQPPQPPKIPDKTDPGSKKAS